MNNSQNRLDSRTIHFSNSKHKFAGGCFESAVLLLLLLTAFGINESVPNRFRQRIALLRLGVVAGRAHARCHLLGRALRLLKSFLGFEGPTAKETTPVVEGITFLYILYF